ncbi:PTS system fructose-specific EIIABC component [Klebsiella pneumoniae]|nr:PTS system fructose-specific EIIABC component [Klebsiella pneumoniae]
MKKIIAVTGCPTGIAHTFMAEEALKTAAKKLNVEIKVETNGASGVENAITPEDLKDIYGVIIAADKDVKEGANKQVISSQADSLIKISRIWADFFPANTSN